MNVLSAEEYIEPTTGEATIKADDGPIQFLGGLIPSTSRRSLRQQNAQAKQKSRRSSRKESPMAEVADQGSVTRQRGRPRLDAQDQSTGDRRRTQIRLAQRAYRQRKETTISELNDHVSTLERCIADMEQTFSSFRERAEFSGIGDLSPDIAQDLRAVAVRFNALAQNRSPTGHADDPKPNSALSARVFEEHGRSNEPIQDISAQNQSDAYLSLPQTSHGSVEGTQVWGYQFYGTENLEQAQAHGALYGAENHGQKEASLGAEWNPQNASYQFHAQVPRMETETQAVVPGFTKPLAAPSTYSFLESTFARRLTRAAYERAYRLLTNPNSRREQILEMCKFTFCFSNSNNVINFMKNKLSKSSQESLEIWEAPLLHLGDSGLHFPRPLESHVPSDWANKAPMGPRRSTYAETPVPDSMTIEQIIEMTGYQGEWFDPNDVEQYLRSKGLQLDGQSTWLELDVNEVPSLETTQPNAIASPDSYPDVDPSSPVNVESLYAIEPALQATDAVWSGEMANLPDASYMDMNLAFKEPLPSAKPAFSTMAYDSPSIFSKPLPRFDTAGKKIVDVERFIEIVVNQGVCLGRSPGWRRSTIDAALTHAIHDDL